jgi:outer membrane lipoprotein SlyB
VQSVTRVERGGAAAAGGGTAGRVVDGVAYRLTVRMDDGTVQTVLQDSAEFRPGDRVRLTGDGKVIRL